MTNHLKQRQKKLFLVFMFMLSSGLFMLHSIASQTIHSKKVTSIQFLELNENTDYFVNNTKLIVFQDIPQVEQESNLVIQSGTMPAITKNKPAQRRNILPVVSIKPFGSGL